MQAEAKLKCSPHENVELEVESFRRFLKVRFTCAQTPCSLCRPCRTLATYGGRHPWASPLIPILLMSSGDAPIHSGRHATGRERNIGSFFSSRQAPPAAAGSNAPALHHWNAFHMRTRQHARTYGLASLWSSLSRAQHPAWCHGDLMSLCSQTGLTAVKLEALTVALPATGADTMHAM